jgi:hypothetical protein
MSAVNARRRLMVAGLVAGVAIGAAVGATTLTGASSEAPTGPRPVVLHVAKVLADPGTDLTLTAGLACPGLAASSTTCDVRSAIAHVLPEEAGAWADVVGRDDGGGYRFVVPGDAVGDDGLSYWLEFRTTGGEAVRLPDGGADTPFRVVTTAGLREVAWPGGFDLSTPTRTADSVVARLVYGDGAREVGRVGGVGDEQPLGPSSFDVAPDGSLSIADWVHRRVLVLSARGAHRRTVPLPVGRPVDVAVAMRGELAVTTLGLGATAFELGADGRVIGRYRVAHGVAERIALTPGGPHVWVGPAQWAPVRSHPGIALPAAAQSRGLASAVPGRDGSVALSQELGGGRIAFVWARPDGSRAGAVLALPVGAQPGVDHFVQGLPDGGAIAARGLWSGSGEAVALLRFRADGTLATADLVPPPTREMDAAASGVRFRAPDEVLVAYTNGKAFRIERFEVRAR